MDSQNPVETLKNGRIPVVKTGTSMLDPGPNIDKAQLDKEKDGFDVKLEFDATLIDPDPGLARKDDGFEMLMENNKDDQQQQQGEMIGRDMGPLMMNNSTSSSSLCPCTCTITQPINTHTHTSAYNNTRMPTHTYTCKYMQ